ncbi:MAG TPA: tripartite tricarboxylate transporter substrate binding protein [Burkholderiales bacterium]|jgi:tripartite-type tricarboxylate transporter receptor subunit TctC|nr:tripartite tricarboxylate transporter substrate binding protein [Burkholderiales bacterium]
MGKNRARWREKTATGVAQVLWSLALFAAAAAAQDPGQAYPSGPLRIVVPFQAGGSTDMVARAMAQKLRERFNQPAVVENRAGANGTIGAALVAKSPPDGHTMLLVQSGFVSNPILMRNLPYDQARDLAPVSSLASGPMVLVVNPSLAVKSVKELIEFARSHPGELNFGSPGTGSLSDLCAELFDVMAGVKMTHVPYKGSGGALADVLAGRVPVYYMNLMLALPYVKDGRLRALGVTTSQRSPVTPEIPTIDEAGLRGYEMSTWYGLFVQGATPRGIVARLQRELASILDQADMKERIAADGMTVVASTPEQFAEFLVRETAKYTRIIEAAGIKAID